MERLRAPSRNTMAKIIEIDVRDLRGRALFEKIRDEFTCFCREELEAEILTSDRRNLPKILAFVAMSGGKSHVEEQPGYWRIRVTGDACSCR